MQLQLHSCRIPSTHTTLRQQYYPHKAVPMVVSPLNHLYSHLLRCCHHSMHHVLGTHIPRISPQCHCAKIGKGSRCPNRQQALLRLLLLCPALPFRRSGWCHYSHQWGKSLLYAMLGMLWHCDFQKSVLKFEEAIRLLPYYIITQYEEHGYEIYIVRYNGGILVSDVTNSSWRCWFVFFCRPPAIC